MNQHFQVGRDPTNSDLSEQPKDGDTGEQRGRDLTKSPAVCHSSEINRSLCGSSYNPALSSNHVIGCHHDTLGARRVRVQSKYPLWNCLSDCLKVILRFTRNLCRLSMASLPAQPVPVTALAAGSRLFLWHLQYGLRDGDWWVPRRGVQKPG